MALELEEIRSLTLEALKNFANGTAYSGNNIQIPTIVGEVARVAGARGLIPVGPGEDPAHARLSDVEHDRVREVVTNFFVEGILMWGLDSNNPNLPFMGITEYGRKVLAAGQVIPNDPDGYLKRFRQEVSNASDVVITYLTEGVQTFRHNNLLASSVMLGVASEAAFLELYDAMTNALDNQTKKSKFENLAKRTSLKDRFDAVKAELQHIKKSLPYPLSEDFEGELEGIFNLIRHQRNDSGHPTSKQVSRDRVFVSLQLFVTYCSHVYQLIGWLKNNRITV